MKQLLDTEKHACMTLEASDDDRCPILRMVMLLGTCKRVCMFSTISGDDKHCDSLLQSAFSSFKCIALHSGA